jgi:hypothetical protein
MKIRIPLSPGAVTQFLLRVVAGLVVLFVLTQMTVYFLPDYVLRDFFADKFNLNYEGNIPTFYSFLALLFSSVLLGEIAHVKNLDNDRYKNHWKILSFIFLYLSLDEIGQVHEDFAIPMQKLLNATGFLYFTWIVPFGFLVAIFALSYSKFLFHLPVSTKKMFVAAFVLYVGGAIGMEMPGGYLASTTGKETVLYLIVMTIEEVLEMLGIVVFIHALMSYIKIYLGGVSCNVYIEGKKPQFTQTPNTGIPAIREPANRNLLR